MQQAMPIDAQAWVKRFERERTLRKEAERLLEEKSLELYNFNLELNEKVLSATEELRQNNDQLISTLDFVSKQNEIIKKTEKSLRQSMEAAKRIQKAMLPNVSEFSGFSSHYVAYLPKDVVSGDFYWVKRVGNRSVVVVADCTGHGVPGAFLSLIGQALLNKIVIDHEVFLPDHILFYLNTYLIDFFKRGNNEIHEGMEAGVCVYNHQTRVLRFAGAMIPLYTVSDGVLTETKPDKVAIGGKHFKNEEQTYTLHEWVLKKKTRLYLSTDGYQDQFGGPEAKKLMRHQFKKLLFELHNQPMGLQHDALVRFFDEWKGTGRQIDDVLVMGLLIDL